jgi:AcrR family transcriptional regulator
MNEKKTIRINEIIEAAICEFIEKGYQAATMESIAERSKLSKGGLYHHFKSKSEVLFAVNLKCIEPVHEMIFYIEQATSLAEGFKKFIAGYLEYWNKHQRELDLYFTTMNESYSNPQIMQLYRDSTAQHFDYLEMLLERGQETGLFTQFEARAHAYALISCLDGYLGYMLFGTFVPLQKMIEEIQQIYVNRILK